MRFADRQTMLDFLGLLKAQNVHISVAATGGGARIQGLLWDLPGASSFLGSSFFSYPPEETENLTGIQLKSFSSPEAALHMAMAMYAKSCEILETRMRRLERNLSSGETAEVTELLHFIAETKPIGLALTASVASERIHRGDHRMHIAVVTSTSIELTSLVLPKAAGQEARDHDGELCDLAALNALAHALHLNQIPMLRVARLVGDCAPSVSLQGAPYGLTPQAVGEEKARELFMQFPYFAPTGRRLDFIPTYTPFNFVPVTGRPLHEGHEGMARVLEEYTNRRSIFLVATSVPPGHPKKPPTVQDMLTRVGMVRTSNVLNQAERGIYFSRSCLFIDMVREHTASFPVGVAVGADAFLRAIDPKWYPSSEAMVSMFSEIAKRGMFYVFDRKQEDKVLTSDVVFAETAKVLGERLTLDLVRPLRGRWDISSTAIRQGRGLE